ncbi:androgen-induced gene 1 protein isoform X2 [Lasioglossum baleicum]|uniref:androgen-induced gene 1 protein isoform X2 n=1 Tax=Lasioglossum baleicum TaxID=434251 RepID=UPI003FCE95AF
MGGCRGSRGKLSKRRPALKWTHPFDKVLSVFQRFSDMAYTLNQIVHTSMFLTYVFSLFKAFHLEFPRQNATVTDFDPGMLKFMTIWNLILQAIFFLICMLNDWFGTNAVNPKKPPLIRKFKDFLHASLGFPIATFVTIVFWSLMFIDRELVFPKVLDPYFPWWLNHLMHTMVFISTLIEMIMAPRQYPRRLVGVGTVVIFGFGYLVWVHVIHYKSGIWVYPLLPLMSVPVRMLFMTSMIVVNAILYFVGEAIDNFVWGKKYVAESDRPVW